jgi:hypothetical protein
MYKIFIVCFLLCLKLYAFEEKDKNSLIPPEEHLFVVITPEKTGTHLLTKTLELLVNKKTRNCWTTYTPARKYLLEELELAKQENAFLQIHALPTPEVIHTLLEHQYRVIFLMRDPRDVIISLLFYIEKGWALGPLRLNFPYGNLTIEEKLDELITGQRYGLSAPKKIIGNRMAWLNEDPAFVYTVHFENLVGPKGGGNLESQIDEIKQIIQHLGLIKTPEEILEISKNLFGTPGEKTFRQGKIGSWREFFKPYHIEAFKVHFGSELIQLGYERDFNWRNQE